jgi:hypothetical protein
MLWAVMKHELNARGARTRAAFKEILQEVWDDLSVTRCINPLVDSFQDRVRLVERKGGRSIQAHLHGTLRSIGELVYGPFPRPPPLVTAQKVEELCALHLQIGNKWAEIARRTSIDKALAKHRIELTEGRRSQLTVDFHVNGVADEGRETAGDEVGEDDDPGLDLRVEVTDELVALAEDEEDEGEAGTEDQRVTALHDGAQGVEAHEDEGQGEVAIGQASGDGIVIKAVLNRGAAWYVQFQIHGEEVEWEYARARDDEVIWPYLEEFNERAVPPPGPLRKRPARRRGKPIV